MRLNTKYILWLIYLNLIIFVFNTSAQNSKVDSLLAVNKKLKDTDTNKTINFLKIVQEYR